MTKSSSQPCLSYDSSMMAESLDEAMFTFPNLASTDQATLFQPPNGFGAAGGGSVRSEDGQKPDYESVDGDVPMASMVLNLQKFNFFKFSF